MTQEQQAIVRLDKAKAELNAAQAEVDRLRSAWMIRNRIWGAREGAFRKAMA